MLANWVKEATPTVGPGPIALGGAPAGFVPFSAAFASGQAVFYTIEDGANREIGIGTLASGSPWTLARTKVLETLVSGTYTNSGATAITLSGSATVSVSSSAFGAVGDFSACFSTIGGFSDGPDTFSAGGSVTNQAANAMLITPFMVFTPRKITSIFNYISTGDPSVTNCRFGLYASAPNGFAGKVLYDSGNVASSYFTGGGTTATHTLASPLILKPGLYWCGWATDSTVLALSSRSNSFGPNSSYYNARAGFYMSGVTGAIPDNPTITGQAGSKQFVFGWK